MNKIGIVLLFFVVFAVEVFSHTGKKWTYNQMNANRDQVTAEIMKKLEPNGCGSYSSPEWLVKILNAIGEKEACDIHDIDYATLGMSKYEADMRLYFNLRSRVSENYDRILSILKNNSNTEAQGLYKKFAN